MMDSSYIDIESIKYLCFGVGGANGWVFVGIIRAFESQLSRIGRSITHQLRGASGASVGSLLALACILNFGATELQEFFIRCTYHYRDEIKNINVLDMSSKMGVIDPIVIRHVAGDMIAQKLGECNRDVTMKKLFDITNKHFIVTTHDVCHEKNQVIDHKTMPNIPASLAVAMSCAITGIFHAVEYEGSLYTDSGISNGLPFECFPLEESLVFNMCVRHGYESPENIGVYDYFCRVLHAFDVLTKTKIDGVPEHLRNRIITLDVPCVISSVLKGFVLSEDMRLHLINIGLRAGLTIICYTHVALYFAAFQYTNIMLVLRPSSLFLGVDGAVK